MTKCKLIPNKNSLKNKLLTHVKGCPKSIANTLRGEILLSFPLDHKKRERMYLYC